MKRRSMLTVGSLCYLGAGVVAIMTPYFAFAHQGRAAVLSDEIDPREIVPNQFTFATNGVSLSTVTKAITGGSAICTIIGALLVVAAATPLFTRFRPAQAPARHLIAQVIAIFALGALSAFTAAELAAISDLRKNLHIVSIGVSRGPAFALLLAAILATVLGLAANARLLSSAVSTRATSAPDELADLDLLGPPR